VLLAQQVACVQFGHHALVAERGERVAGYRGTVALTVIVPNPSLEIALVALDLWDHVRVLRGAATPDRESPFWLLNSWRITTERGTLHVARDGGSGSSLAGSSRAFVARRHERDPGVARAKAWR
jgi:hypothetical protein